MANDVKWAVYVQAQAAAHHTDQIMWNITAIIFGANTVLFGLILGAAEKRSCVPLLISSIVGLSLTIFAARVCHVSQVAKRVGYGICREIESELPETEHQLRLHTRIDELYPKGMARRWVYGICLVFSGIWLGVFLYGWWLLFRAATGTGAGLL